MDCYAISTEPRHPGEGRDPELKFPACAGMNELGPVNTNPMGSVAPEKASIKARGEKFSDSK